MGIGPVRLLLLSRLSLDKHTTKMVLDIIFYSGSEKKTQINKHKAPYYAFTVLAYDRKIIAIYIKVI